MNLIVLYIPAKRSRLSVRTPRKKYVCLQPHELRGRVVNSFVCYVLNPQRLNIYNLGTRVKNTSLLGQKRIRDVVPTSQGLRGSRRAMNNSKVSSGFES